MKDHILSEFKSFNVTGITAVESSCENLPS